MRAAEVTIVVSRPLQVRMQRHAYCMQCIRLETTWMFIRLETTWMFSGSTEEAHGLGSERSSCKVHLHPLAGKACCRVVVDTFCTLRLFHSSCLCNVGDAESLGNARSP